MKSRISRKVVLKHPALRSVRKCLREVIKQAVQAEITRLLDLEILYTHKKRKYITPSQQKRKSFLCRTRLALKYVFRNSTCVCHMRTLCYSYKELLENGLIEPNELPNDLDMAWFPVKRSWYCVKCFEEFILPWCEEEISPPPEYYEDFPDPDDHFNVYDYFFNRRYWYIEEGVIYPVPGSERKDEPDEYIKYFNYEYRE